MLTTRGYGDAHEEAARINALANRLAAMPERVADDAPHGLTETAHLRMMERFENFMPAAAHTGGWSGANTFFEKLLPSGAALAPGAGASYSAAMRATSDRSASAYGVGMPGDFGGGNVMMQVQRPYYPEFDSRDRQSYPNFRQQANMNWRMFNKLDPVCGQATEMYATMPWGDFALTGEGVDGEIKQQLERQIELCRLKAMLPYFGSEYLIVGEVAPHLYYSSTDGIYTMLALHNPDFLDVIYVPSVMKEPLVQFRPDPKLRQIITSNHPMMEDVRETMPKELLAAISSGQPIPLMAPNFSLIARRLHPYDIRGTSIYSRMWRAFMFEDCGVAGTPISMADGTTKSIEDVRVGDTVLDRKGHAQEVEASVEKPAEVPYEVTLWGGTKIKVTGSHQWPVWAYPRTCQCGCGEAVSAFKSFKATHVTKGTAVAWRAYGGAPNERWSKRRLPAAFEPIQKLKTRDLQKNDFLMVPRTFDEVPTRESEAYARLLGYYLAEGSISEPNGSNYTGVRFDFNLDEIDTWVSDVVEICAGLGVEAHVYPHEERSACTVVIHKKEFSWLAEKLERDGSRYSHEKHVSAEVMRWPLALKRQLLTGYIRGDGSASIRIVPTTKVAATFMTVSNALADQLWLLCAQVGWPVTHRSRTKHACKDGRKRRLRNEMSMQGPWVDEVMRDVFQIEVKRSARANPWSKVWMDDAFVYLPIKRVRRLRKAVPVFGLTVSNDRSYMMNGVGTYNSVFDASLATARRAAAPLKVMKLGDPATGVIPSPAVREEHLRVLAQCESDVQAWFVTNFSTQFDLVGNADRLMSIDKHWDLVTSIKLIAFGISKAFLSGEVSYASAASGLSIFLRKLKSFRSMFENEWIIPKFFRQVAITNGWVKRSQAELSHNIRVVRSQRELLDDSAYITPKLEWSESLDPTVNTQMVSAMSQLDQLGVRFSEQSLMGVIGKDWEKELRQRGQEARRRKEILAEYPELAAEEAARLAGDGGDGGGGGGGMLPGLGPDIFPPDDGGSPIDGLPGGSEGGDLGGDNGMPPLNDLPPAPAAAAGDEGDQKKGPSVKPARGGAWTAEEVADVQAVLRGHSPEEEPWRTMVEEIGPPKSWHDIRGWLSDRAYPEDLVSDLEAMLKRATRGARRVPGAVDQRALLDRASKRLLSETRDLEHPDYLTGFGSAGVRPPISSGRRTPPPGPRPGGGPRR